jgi:hypothetical protein
VLKNSNDVRSLIDQFGPQLVFHQDEQYFLDMPDAILDSSTQLVWGIVTNENNPAAFTQTELGRMTTSADTLLADTAAVRQLPEASTPGFQIWLDVDPSLRAGNLARAKSYVQVVELSSDVVHLQFWFYSPYNGPIGKAHASIPGLLDSDFFPEMVGRHTGDWEHITLRLVRSQQTGSWGLAAVFLSQHSGGQWVAANDLAFVPGTSHPIIYVAKDSHAFYSSIDEFPQLMLTTPFPTPYGVRTLSVSLVDRTSAGTTYDAYKRGNYRIVSANTPDLHLPAAPDWLSFDGRWGPYEYLSYTGVFGQLRFPYREVGKGPVGPMQHVAAWVSGDGQP